MTDSQNNVLAERKIESQNLENLPHIIKNMNIRPKFLKDILQHIGETPLVKLNKIPQSEGVQCDMFVKCEYLNHGGSIKDRIAYRMVVDAEQNGTLIPGESVIIEPSSGNTGIGLALVSLVKGYRCIIVIAEKNSDEKVNTLRAMGAEVVRPDASESSIAVAKRLVKETPGGVMLNQFGNISNIMAHYDGTAEEILWSLDYDLDMAVMGVGTSGTLCGIGKRVKKSCPKCIVVGVDPYGSILADPKKIYPYEVEGIGDETVPVLLDYSVVNKWVKTNDENSFQMARRLIREEGILCGGSSGAAMWAAIQEAKNLKPGQKCVVVMPDSIRNYMSMFIWDPWMEVRGFKPLQYSSVRWWYWEVPKKVIQRTPTLSHKSSVEQAFIALRQSCAPLVSIVDDKGSLIGVFTADYTRRRLTNKSNSFSDNLEKLTKKKYYKVDLAEKPTLGLVSRMLEMDPFVVVVNTESPGWIHRPIGVITSDSLLFNVYAEEYVTFSP